MKIGWLILVFAFFTSFAHAETIVMRSGEHSDFSRLVLDFEARPAWELQRAASEYDIVFDTQNLDVDPSRVFDKIPKSRLKEVYYDASNHTLTLKVSDNCHVKVFELDSNKLVLDIRDGAPTEILTQPKNQEIDRPTNTVISKQPFRLKVGQFPTREETLKLLDQTIETRHHTVDEEKPENANKGLQTSKSHTTKQFESDLLLQLGRVANFGLIDVLPQTVHTPESPTVYIDDLKYEFDQKTSVSANYNLHKDPTNSYQQNNVNSPECAVIADHDLSQWAPEGDHKTQLHQAVARANSTATNNATPETIRSIQTRLYAGLGAEALVEINTLNDSSLKSFFTLVAEALMRTSQRKAPLLAPELECNKFAAFWHSFSTWSDGGQLKDEQSQQIFSSLPLHIQNKLKTIYNLNESSREVEDPKTAIETSSLVVLPYLSNEEQVALRRATRKLEEKIEISRSELTLFESLYFENRKTPISPHTKTLYVEALSNRTNFIEALKIISQTSNSGQDFDEEWYLSRVFSASLSAPAEAFLTLQFHRDAAILRSKISSGLQKKLNARLDQLGFSTGTTFDNGSLATTKTSTKPVARISNSGQPSLLNAWLQENWPEYVSTNFSDRSKDTGLLEIEALKTLQTPPENNSIVEESQASRLKLDRLLTDLVFPKLP